MNAKKTRKNRQKEYDKWMRTHPQHADGMKRLIYQEDKVKDNYGIVPEVNKLIEPLQFITKRAEWLLDEELHDLKYMLQDKLGKKTLKKLGKILAL